jgi:hypothetical protein
MLTDKIINYRELIDRSIQGFVGRRWVREAVDAFLTAAGPRVFLVLGEPGSGKTAFLADLVRQRGYPHHFIGKGSLSDVASSADWRNPTRYAESIGYQLLRDYGGWIMDWESWGIRVEQRVRDLGGLLVGAKVGELRLRPGSASHPMLSVGQEVERFGPAAQVVGVYVDRMIMDPEQVVRQLVTIPLRRIAERDPDRQVVLIVDGLDEAEGYSTARANILRLLPGSETPANVRLILSSRPGPHLTNDFLSGVQAFWLSRDDRGHLPGQAVEDARDFLRHLSAEPEVGSLLAASRTDAVALIRRVAEASAGNFLYLYHYAQGVRRGDAALLDLSSIPQGLYGIYGDFLSKIRRELADVAWDKEFKPVAGALAVAQEPFLTRRQLATLVTVEEQTVGTILSALGQFLQADGKGKNRRYRFFHPSFAEYLVSEENPDTIGAASAHRHIADHYWKSCRGAWQRCDPYALANLARHLAGTDDAGRLRELISKPWMDARVEGDGFRYAGFLADVDLARRVTLAERAEAGDTECLWGTLTDLVRLGLIRTSLASLSYEIPPPVLAQTVNVGLWSSRQALDVAARLPPGSQQALAFRLLLATGKLDAGAAAEARQCLEAAGETDGDGAASPARAITPNLRAIPVLEQPCTPALRATLEQVLGLESENRLGSQTRLEAQMLSLPIPRQHRSEFFGPPGAWERLLDALVAAYAPQAEGIARAVAWDELLHRHLGVRMQFVTFNPARERHPLLALALEWCWDESLAARYAPAALRLVGEMPEALRVQTLAALAGHLPDDALSQEVQEALSLAESAHRQWILGLLASRLSAELLRQALASLRQVRGDEQARLAALAALMPALEVDVFRQSAERALALARDLPAADPTSARSPRAETLLRLIPLLPADLRDGAIEACDQATGAIPFQENATRVAKAQALAALVPLYSRERRQDLITRALDTAYYSEEPAFWAPTLATLYREMDPDDLVRRLTSLYEPYEKRGLLRRVQDEWEAQHRLDYSTVARCLLHAIVKTPLTPSITQRALLSLAPQLEGAGLDDALEVLDSRLFSEESRSEAWIALAPRMDAAQARSTLTAAEGLTRFRLQAQVVGAAAARLPQVEQVDLVGRTLTAALEQTDPADQAAALGALAAGRLGWAQANAGPLGDALLRLLDPEPRLTRQEYLQRLTDLHPIWSALTPGGAVSAVTLTIIEVCWHWQWK